MGVRVTSLLCLRALVACTATVTFCAPAQGHPESVSTLRLTLTPRALQLKLVLPVRDLSRWFPPGKYKNYISDVVADLKTKTDDLFVVAADEQLIKPSRVDVHPGLVGFIVVEEDFATHPSSSLQLRSLVLGYLPNDHQQTAILEDHRGGRGAQRILAEEVLNAQQDLLAVDIPEAIAVADVTASQNLDFMHSPPATQNLPLRRLIGPYLVAITAILLLLRYISRKNREKQTRSEGDLSCGRS